MTAGPGKYDHLASYCRKQADARATIVIILGGKHGDGFSVQAEEGISLQLPAILRHVADSIAMDTE